MTKKKKSAFFVVEKLNNDAATFTAFEQKLEEEMGFREFLRNRLMGFMNSGNFQCIKTFFVLVFFR